jgi:hypothetical protein
MRVQQLATAVGICMTVAPARVMQKLPAVAPV